MRIVLVAAILAMAAWFTVLKPKDAATPAEPAATAVATPAVPQSAAGRFRAKAEAGKATAEADAERAAGTEAESGGAAATTGTPSTSASAGSATARAASRVLSVPPLSAKATARLPSEVRGALERREVIVLGILSDTSKPWAPMADDDRLERRELRSVNRSGGDLVVETVPLAKISRFDILIRALDVSQSPTVVVIDGNRQGIALTGYVDRVTINQAVADARRQSTERRITETYLRKTNLTCSNMNTTFTRLSRPTVRGAEGAWIARLAGAQRRYRQAFARIAAPRPWRSLKSQIVAGVRAGEVRLAAAGKNAGLVDAAVAAPRDRPLAGLALERRFTAAGLTACSATRSR